MQLVKPSILCTGPVDLTMMHQSLRDSVDIDIIPFTEISSSLTDETTEEIKNIIKKKAVVVFTSGNALRSVATLLDSQKPEWSVYCMGNTTYELAKSIFGDQQIRQTANDAASLAKMIIAEKEAGDVIFFCGNLRRKDLPELLQKNNIGVKEIITYHTTPIQPEIKREYDAVLFFSPSAADSFFSHHSLPERTRVFVIGATTAEKVKSSTRNTVFVSDKPDKLHLVGMAVNSLVSPLA